MNTFLIALFLGMFLGYAVCDLLTVDSKIIYQIRRFKQKNSPGGQIDIEQGENANLPVLSNREYRKQARVIRRNERNKRKADKRLNK